MRHLLEFEKFDNLDEAKQTIKQVPQGQIKMEIPNSTMDAEEMGNIIYDTLMSDKNHSFQFRCDLSTNEVNSGNIIEFRYLGNDFRVTIEKI